jgi:prolyl-tRNA synthetase
VCLRIELGPKDVQKSQCVMVRRDQCADRSKKEFVPLETAVAKAQSMLEQMQKDLFERAKAFRVAHTFEVHSYDEMKGRADEGFLLAHWDGTPETEARIKEETGLTTRNRPFDLVQEAGSCPVTGKPSPGRILFAKSY